MDANEMREVDWAIIDVLEEGRNNAPNLADRTGYSKQYLRERLKRLSDEGVLINIGSGIYELNNDEIPDTE